MFIDEVADLSPLGQVKLLRALSERRYSRIGSRDSKKIECCIISSTNQETKLYNPHMFREDLRARLEQQRIVSWTPDRYWDLRDIWINFFGATLVQLAIAKGLKPQFVKRRPRSSKSAFIIF